MERGTAALTARDLADEASKKDKSAHVAQVRVVQGSEPTFFTSIFGGLMTVHAGGAKGSMEQKGAHLYHIKGTTGQDTKAFEVEPTASNLNSGDSFVVVVPASATAYMWTGKGSNEAEKEAAAKLGSKLVSQWTEKAAGIKAVAVAEGAEPAEFWSALGGKAEYASAVPPPTVQKARLLEVSDASGALHVDEIHNWGQQDLVEEDVMILDAGSTVFVWVGKGASPAERSNAVDIAQKYVAAGVAAGSHDDNAPIIKVEQGAEPAIFTAQFPGWDRVATEVLSDPYAAKLAELAKHKAEEAEAVATAAAEREAKRAAAVAAAEAKKGAGAHADGSSAALASAAGHLKHVEAKAGAPAPAAAGGNAIEAAASHLKHVEAKEAGAPAASGGPAPEITGALSGITVTYNGAAHPIELLKAVTPTSAGPFAGIAFDTKESLLADKDFPAVFGMDKKAFEALPKWKKQDTKKKAGLF